MRTYRVLSLIIAVVMLFSLVPFVGAQEPADGKSYIMVAGDTLADVATRFLGDAKYVPAIMDATTAKSATDKAYPALKWTDQAKAGDWVWVPTKEAADKLVAAYEAKVMPLDAFKAKQWTIGFSNASETNNFRAAMRQAMEDYFAKNYPNVKLIRTDANDQPAKQLADLEDLLAQGVNALIISPATTDVANPILDKAAAKNIPVIILDRSISSPNYTSYVATDYYNQGLAFTDMVAKAMGGKGRLVIVEGTPGAGPAILHSQAYDEALRKYPDIKVVARQAGNWSRQSGFEAIENILAATPEFDGMIGDGSEMTCGMVDGLKAHGWTDDQIKKIVIGGLDNYNGYMKLIKTGMADVGFRHSPYDNGFTGAEAAVLGLRGAYLPKFWALKVGPITADNVDELVSMDKPDDWWLPPAGATATK